MTHESSERKTNLWAPWRMAYIRELDGGGDGCFLCDYREQPQRDAENLVLWRGTHTLAVLNRFPYTGGHMLVAPLAHVGDLRDLDDAVLLELMQMIRDGETILRKAIGPQGFNVGINIGAAAGAGLPGHLHVHIVPRWGGDTNFMAVLGDIRVIPESLEVLYANLRTAAAELGLPKAAPVEA